MKGRILIVEDELKLLDIMRLYLEKEGYEVTTVSDGSLAEDYIGQQDFDLIILDVMLPKKDGWSLLRKIKAHGETPVILTTARGEEEDRIFGLELGAEDYMVKPISMRELVLRCSLRIRCKMIKAEPTINLSNMTIDEATREVRENNVIISLTPREFDLLLFLAKNINLVFTREQLLDKVWGYEFAGDTRTVDTHVKNLREKLAYCSNHIKTLWGVGYKLEG